MLAETMRDLEEMIPSPSDYVQEGEDGETIIRQDVALLIDGFGSRVAKSLKMSLLQGLGANAKIEGGLKAAMIEGAITNQMPLLKLAAEIFGIPVEKYLKKHPDAMMQLAPMAQQLMGNKGGFDIKSLLGGSPQINQPQGHDGVGYG